MNYRGRGLDQVHPKEINRLCCWSFKNLGVFKNIANFTGNTCAGFLLNKIADLQDLLKRDFNTDFFL